MAASHGAVLVWPGRAWEPGKFEGSSPQIAPVESVGNAWHRLIHGDVLALAAALRGEGLAGKVDLVYVDPPYASERDYVAEARLDGPADGRVSRTRAYEDRWSSGVGAYLDMLAPRLDALASLLAETGTIWVHVDWRASYLVRSLLDEILGRDAFRNEIVWRRAPNLGRQAASGQFGRTLDTIVVYGKPRATIRPPTRLEPIEESSIRWDDEGRPFTTAPRGDYTDASIAKLETQGRVHRTKAGKVYIKYFLVKDAAGVWCRERRVDALWTDVPPLRHAAVSERTGFPTQKPRALLERIVTCAAPVGGLVVDAFAGSGTTAIAAHALGRRAIVGDKSAVAIAAARARLLREGAGFVIERAAGAVDAARAPTVRVAVRGGVVRLVEPKEPLAWSVGTERAGVFHGIWHGVRAPGARAVPAPREAPLPARDVRVRVWADDGGVATKSVAAAREERPEVSREARADRRAGTKNAERADA